MNVSEEVRLGIANGRVGVVALESTIITHGMPYPDNLHTALAVEQVVRDNGAIPATIAIIDGVIKIGLSRAELEVLAKFGTKAAKVSRRDLAQVVASKSTGSTTVATTMLIAHAVGIRVFATGGIGGVHRGAELTWDISADITELARTPVLVVCAGAKSILDLPRTLELLETGGVCVMGFRTGEFPAFFTAKSGLKTSATVDSESEVAHVLRTHLRLGMTQGLLLACPIPAASEGDAEVIERATEEAVKEAEENGVLGREITPFLLKRINEKTHGMSLKSNIALIKNNAAIAARVAREFAAPYPIKTECSPDFTACDMYVIGGIGFDTIASPEDSSIAGETRTSSPGIVRTALGGVGRNIYACIKQLGGDVVFSSAVGSDNSAATAAVLAEAGRDCNLSLQKINSGRTAHYSAVMNGDGSLCSAIADMSIFDSFVPKLGHANHSPRLLVLDANLSEKSIRSLCINAKRDNVPVWIDSVSVAKCVKVLPSLPYLALVKANVDELASMAAIEPFDVALKEITRDSLRDWVVRAVDAVRMEHGGDGFLITCEKNGVFLLERKVEGVKGNHEFTPHVFTSPGSNTSPEDKTANISVSQHGENEGWIVWEYQSPPIENTVDCTGAGDSLFGTVAWAHAAMGLPLHLSVVLGIAAARLTLMSTESVSPEITNANFATLMKDLHSKSGSKLVAKL